MTPSVTADSTRQEFLNLLVTQLQNQDPLDPIGQEEHLGQLAQFSTLEGIENLNASFEQLLRLQQLTQGADLVGRTVSFRDTEGGPQKEGIVESVDVQSGQISLTVNETQIELEQIVAVTG